MTTLPPTPFNCPNCDASYHLVHAEAGPDSEVHKLTCLRCGGPLQRRRDRFVLKYFCVDKAGKRSRRPPNGGHVAHAGRRFSKSGSLAKLTAIRHASSRVSRLAAER